ncbi:hypothetical protein L211DRAFT_845258 [Terfezia boudieri ATCC MYA-4762]|uniref:Retrotransposon Copia-like N-terminal domain-containing protein n=1 Tax=Terfezia boudieri ATCC MYA-4762 TaxID=1051890 RepID=A0A3N4M288_9PEZI|nr:hypothetical protein L211DRAFT_845258 [Terfezia boudieri ATCC MYA-4762]
MSSEAGPFRSRDRSKMPERPPQHPQSDDDEEILDTVHVSAATAPQPPPPDFLAPVASQAAPVPMSALRGFKSSVKIERLATLEGSKNYDLWSQQMLMVFDAIEATQVVVYGYRPPVTATAAEQAKHKHIETESLLLIIQVVSDQIMLQIGRHRSAHNIWQYLRKTYYRDTHLSFVHEIHAFNTLSSTLDSSQSISEFIDTFEIRWMRLHTLTSNARPGSFKAAYRTLLELEEAKREYLLASLVTHYLNVVDTLTKDHLSYKDLKVRLIGLAINNQLPNYNGSNNSNNTNTALVANNRQNNKARRKKSQQDSASTQSTTLATIVPGTRTCTYCKKHGHRFKGHVWQDCRKLKRDQQSKKARSTVQEKHYD